MKCDHCGNEVRDGSVYCHYCGSKITYPQNRLCPNCHKELSEDMQFCSSCGTRVVSQSPTQDTTPKPNITEPMHTYTATVKQSTANMQNRIAEKGKMSAQVGKFFGLSKKIGVLLDFGAVGLCFWGYFKGQFGLTFAMLIVAIIVQIALNIVAKNLQLRCDAIAFDEAMSNPCNDVVTDDVLRQAETNIKAHLSKSIISLIVAGVILILGLLLFFVPFFSTILTDVSIYDMIEDVMPWNFPNLFSDDISIATELLCDVCSESSFSSFYKLMWVKEFMPLILMFIAVIFIVASFFVPIIKAITRTIEYYRFKNNDDYKKAIMFSYVYGDETNRNNVGTVGGRIIGLIIHILSYVLVFFPFADILWTLPIYFEGLTNNAYYVVLFLYAATVIFWHIYVFFAPSFKRKERWIECILKRAGTATPIFFSRRKLG